MSACLLEARDVTRLFSSAGKKPLQAVSGVSLKIFEGETLGVVGESGCGKSTLGKLMIRTLQPTSGEVLFRGQSVTGMKEKEFLPFRKELQMIFQDPYASLDPRMTVRDLIAEPIETWHLCDRRSAVTDRVRELLQARAALQSRMRAALQSRVLPLSQPQVLPSFQPRVLPPPQLQAHSQS